MADQKKPPAAAPTLPAPQPVRIAGPFTMIPLATLGVLSDVNKEIYALFGITTDVLLVGDSTYTVLTNQLEAARDAIRRSKHENVSLGTFTTRVPTQHVLVPNFQPQLTETRARLYEALGIDTMDVVIGDTVFTVLATQLASAKLALSALFPQSGRSEELPLPLPLSLSTPTRTATPPTPAPSAPALSSPSRPAPSPAQNALYLSSSAPPRGLSAEMMRLATSASARPARTTGAGSPAGPRKGSSQAVSGVLAGSRLVSVSVAGITLSDYYESCPSQELLALAALFNVRFLRIQVTGDKLIWVPITPGGLGVVAHRLGLFV